MKFKSGQRRRALEYEKAIQQLWKENKTFEKSVAKNPADNSYVFYDGPPFITGVPHHGTLLSSIVKDAVPRYFTMKGKRVERVWGWDCHGLPAENFVEKQLGIVDRRQIVTDENTPAPLDKEGNKLPTISLEKYIKTARESMVSNSETWESTIDRIGRWVDFRGAYRTMDKTFMESVWWAFKKLYDAGKIYEGEKVLMYDTKFATPVSKNEVTMDNDAYQTVTDPSVYVKFRLEEESIGDKTRELGLPVYFLAWTTTPWTLPGNTALAVNPEMTYSEIRVGDEIFILAKDLIDKVLVDEKKQSFEYEVLHDVLPGAKLVGKSYEPLMRKWLDYDELFAEKMNLDSNEKISRDNFAKVWAADYVGADSGTGIVHLAPIYGEEDFRLASEKKFPRLHVLDDDGIYFDEVSRGLSLVFNESFGKNFHEILKKADVKMVQKLAKNVNNFGKEVEEIRENYEVFSVNKMIAKSLEKTGMVWKTEMIRHEYPFNPRSKQRIMYRAIPSWFFDIQNSKPLMLEQNENVNWFPEHLKHGRFAKNIEQAPDWNLSRDRFWATAMPVWKGDKGSIKVVGSYDELYELSGQKLDDYHRPWVDDITFEIDGEKFTRIDKVLDCWFESGSMPFAQFHYPFENQEKFEANYPGDFIVEYVGQVRAWFYYVHAVNTSLAEIGAFGNLAKTRGVGEKNAYKNVITTGVVAGNDGRKMSKSLGNFTDPNVLMDEYSADSLRFLLMSSPVLSGEDFALKDKDVSDVARKLSMIWNMYDFFTMYAEVDGWEFANNVKIDYFVHGTTFDNENEIATGWNPGELSPLGIQQCGEMAKHLQGRKFDAIFCSDLDRAVESAKLFFPGAEIIPDERLRECNYGDLNSQPADQVRDEEHVETPFSNGESMRDVEKRMRNFCEYLGEKHAGKNVAVLAHRAPQLALQVICEGLTWAESFDKDWRKTKNYQPGWEYNYQITAPQISLDELENPLDKWIVSRVHELTAHITKFMDEYNLPDAMSAILPFVDDASNWFVRRSRRRFWKSDDDADKDDAYKTLHYVLVKLSMLLAPFTPFLAEELYQKLTGGESVHLLDWPEEVAVDEKVLAEMQLVRNVIVSGLASRMTDLSGEGKIKIRQPLNELAYTFPERINVEYEQIIAEEVNVKRVAWEDSSFIFKNESDKQKFINNAKEWGVMIIKLDKVLTSELKREGLSREVIRFVQKARKDAGLNVDDRIILELATDDAELQKTIEEWREVIAAETLATEFVTNDGFETTAKIDQSELKIQLKKDEK